MTVRWDNIQILQTIDRHQERSGGGLLMSLNGYQLMNEIAGMPVLDDKLTRGFLRELDILASEEYVTFKAYDPSEQAYRSWPYGYLEQIRDFGLTVKGQDRARGVRIIQPLPSPDEDDGRLIPALLLQQIASAIAGEYRSEQILLFLGEEAGIPLERLPLPPRTPDVRSEPGKFVWGVLLGLDQWASEGRRILRSFIGSWLDDRFTSGPDDRLRDELAEKLARRGWYVACGKLVIGEPAKGKRVRSPILRGMPLQ